MSDKTVYINDNPIGETEVYHANRGHVTTRWRWRDDYTRETTIEQAREEGYRPCQRCFPDSSGESCPGCGYPGDAHDDLAPGTIRCRNDSCRVAVFNENE